MKVQNMDIAGLVRRLRRFRFEVAKSVSSNVAHYSDSDFLRAMTYMDALEIYKTHICAQPQLDLPEVNPVEIELGEADVLDLPENESIYDLMAMFSNMETMLVNSQSSRLGNGLISHDKARFEALLDHMRRLMNDYVKNVQPLDLPESSPMRAVTGEGRKGI